MPAEHRGRTLLPGTALGFLTRAQRERLGNHGAVPANRSRVVPAIAWPVFFIALAGLVAGAGIGGILQHAAPSRLVERPGLDAARHWAATPSEPGVTHRLPPEIAVLVDEHIAGRAALAWSRPAPLCR